MGFLGLVDTEDDLEVPAAPVKKVEPRPITARSGELTGVTVVRTHQ